MRANLNQQVTVVARTGRWRRTQPIVDFGGIDADRAPSCRVDYLILANYDRCLAEAGRFPAEIANYSRIMAGGRITAAFVPRLGTVGGPILRLPAVSEPGR